MLRPVNAPAAVSSSDPLLPRVAEALREEPGVLVAFVYGSVARGRVTPRSDVDVAVAGAEPLSAEARWAMAVRLAGRLGRDVDVIDLRTVTGPVLAEALVRGQRLFVRDRGVYADVLRRHLYHAEDDLPRWRRIVDARRARFLAGGAGVR